MRYTSYVGGGELPAWLREPGERPRILVTRSTLTGPGDRGPMPAVVAAAAEVDAEIVLVRPDERSARSVPGNVRVVDWIPLDEALPASAALVHHGGAGSALGALAAGLPQLATTGPGDRRHNAELVARRGAGLALRPRDITARALTQLLTDERLRTAAAQVSRRSPRCRHRPTWSRAWRHWSDAHPAWPPRMHCRLRQDDRMRHVVLFHSVYGLRPAVRAPADRLRAAGHRVSTPDLYGVPATDTVEEGFALLDKIGQEVVLDRARDALRDLPPETVLAGFSMGAGVAGALLAERPAAAGLLLLHGTGGAPDAVRPGLPVQLHLADPDPYDAPDEVDEWQQALTDAGADLTVFRYPGVGHLFTDPELAEYSPDATAAAWPRVLAFLAAG